MATQPFSIPEFPRMPAELADKVNAFGEDVLNFFHPGMDVSARVTKDMQLANMDQMLIVAGVYVVFVLISFAYWTAFVSQPKLKKQASTATQNFGAKKGESGEKSVAAKFAAEPILVIQAVYNAVQVALCAYMIKETVEVYMKEDYKLIGNPFNADKTGMAACLWVFYVSKVLDFFDTIFMVVRGKWVQFSFLHVYHHTSIFMIYWLNLNVGYDGDIYYTIVLNAFIHFMMYFYYFLRTFNVTVPVAMKMFVTNSQLIQFVTMMAQAAYILAFNLEFPQRITAMYLVYIFTLFLLFSDFKKKTYKGDDKKSK